VGAAGGAAIGHSTATCDKYYASDAPPPPPYYQGGPGYDQRYDDNNGGYYNDGYDSDRQDSRYNDCRAVWSVVYFPDGTTDREQVQACRGPDGHWRVAN
jgi:hypothetical protein